MRYKMFAAIVAAGLLVAFIAPVVVKLKEVSLAIVALTGIAMMLVDLWQAFRSEER